LAESDRKAEHTIEVRIEEISQLFDMLDPFPFRERDLDKDAEEYMSAGAASFLVTLL
jgi:hypothetical protein